EKYTRAGAYAYGVHTSDSRTRASLSNLLSRAVTAIRFINHLAVKSALLYVSVFEAYAYGNETKQPAARTRAQTARSDSVQSGRRPGSQASWDDGEIRYRVVADVVDRRRLLLHPAGFGRDRAVIAVSERGRHLFLDETRVGRRSWVFVRLVLLG